MSLMIFIIVSLSMSNFIINSVKYLILNNNVSTDVLKLRELEIFFNSEFNEYSFDFKVKSQEKLSYSKIVPISSKNCEVKQREIGFSNGTITLRYDGRNVTNLLRNVDDFKINRNGNVVFIKILLGDIELVKTIPLLSYDI